LEDKDKWGDKTSILKVGHESRKRKRINVNLHIRLVPPGGGGKRDVGRMDEDDLGKITGPKENDGDELTHLPD
jgi:hypothetical protein